MATFKLFFGASATTRRAAVAEVIGVAASVAVGAATPGAGAPVDEDRVAVVEAKSQFHQEELGNG